MVPEAAEALVMVVRDAQRQKFVYASIGALFIYDFLITIGDEVELVWSSGFGVAQFFYYAARYSAWLEVVEELLFWHGDMPARACQILGGYNAFSVIFGMGFSQSLIVVRTWAIWNRSPVMKFTFLLLCPISLAFGAYIAVEWMRHTTFLVTSSFAHTQGCAVTSPYHTVYAVWIFFCCNDMILLTLTAIRCREHLQQGSCKFTISLYRNAFGIFLLVLAFAAANLTISIMAAEHYQVLLYGMERMVYTTLACRMMHNLRATAYAPEETTGQNTTGHVLDFRHTRDEMTSGFD